MKKGIIALGLIILIITGAYQLLVYNHHLSFVPSVMNVWRVIYVAEEISGFGPGGDEAGIIVYDMPDETYDMINKKGISWLELYAQNKQNSWKKRYSNWQSTPVPTTLRWANPQSCPSKSSDKYLIIYPNGCPSISGYLWIYGFSFDRHIEAMVNKALFSNGAYYAFNRTGFLIVIPEEKRIVYAYSG